MNHDILESHIKNAFVYGYPIVGMYRMLYQQAIDPATKEAGLNAFAHTATLSTPQTTFVPAPNNDTTYSKGWLDLRHGPVYIDVPDTEDRFYTIQFLDLFSETLANVGRRTTGTKATRFAVVGPEQNGDLPQDCYVIKCTTSFVLAFLRILIHHPGETEIIEKLQADIRIDAPAGYVPDDAQAMPVCDKEEDGIPFFKTLEEILPFLPKSPALDALEEDLGLILNAPAEQVAALCRQTKDAIDKAGLEFGEMVHGWRIARQGIGTYGQDYFQRAVVWFKGALANVPQESLYPSVFQDVSGNLLTGANAYRLVFPAGGLPPVSQFWSLTMYIFKNGFLAENPIDRYSIGDRTENLYYDTDGSLTIYIQREAPKEDTQLRNWLPAPEGEFYMSLRLYGPDEAAIDGRWNPPPVELAAKEPMGNEGK